MPYPAKIKTTAKQRYDFLKGLRKYFHFTKDVNGRSFFWPRPGKGVGCGCLSSHHLRWIADELDRLNHEQH